MIPKMNFLTFFVKQNLIYYGHESCSNFHYTKESKAFFKSRNPGFGIRLSTQTIRFLNYYIMEARNCIVTSSILVDQDLMVRLKILAHIRRMKLGLQPSERMRRPGHSSISQWSWVSA